MKKKRYIKPAVEVLVMQFEQQLLAESPAGGHGGGNPGDTPDEPSSAKFHPVGYDMLWQSDDDVEDSWDSFETKK